MMFGGQIGKIKSLFSFDGIWMLIKAFCGKVFYALSSSFLLVLIPILAIFYGIIRNLKNRNLFAYLIQNRILIVLFMLLSWIMMMLIGSIYMLDYAGRLDFLIYGRYFEFTISPLIFVAFMYLIINKKVSVKVGIVVSAIGYILLTYCINHIIDYSWSTSNIFISCPGIADLLLLNDFGTESLWLVSLRGIIMFFVIVFGAYVWPKIKMYTFIGISVFLCMIWIYAIK